MRIAMDLREETFNLRDSLERTGLELFRWRSFTPLFLLPLFLLTLPGFHYFGGAHYLDGMWEVSCVAISFVGLLVRAFTVGYTPSGTSGRNTDEQIADELNTTGIYSVVRHPLYVGNFLMWFGLVLFTRNVLLVMVVVLTFTVLYERVMLAEEGFLRAKYGDTFETWAKMTPAFIPAFRGWVSSSRPFSLRKVIKREYSGFFAMIVLFTLLRIAQTWWLTGSPNPGYAWTGFFAAGTFVYLALRTIRKHTRWLKSRDRVIGIGHE